MNEEEQKAVDMLNTFRLEHKFFNIRQTDNLEDNIEIVLNLIEKLLKENEKLNNRCRNLDKEAQAYLEELAGDNTLTRRTIKQLQEENEKAVAEYMKWQKQELEQKDKIIEQMTYYIMNLDIDEDICKKVNCDTNSGELDCKDCIKQYFENKAKEIR